MESEETIYDDPESKEEKCEEDDNPEENMKNEKKNKPTIVLIVGMAGSGKTKLLQRINAYVHQKDIPSYLINLDPAVRETPYEPNIDIRDVVNYKEIMKQHGLGPNGGILTSLNLFATRFDQVLNIIEKRQDEIEYVFIDTPGQIEVFSWSASGQIITEAFASTFPTVLLYVVDTPRCADPITFMSNMTYACSMLYKTTLPFLLAFNKNDILREELAMTWMEDLEQFNEDCNKASKSYMTTLTKELGLVLSEFYKHIKCVGVSAVSGFGMKQLFQNFEELNIEYWEEFYPFLMEKKKRLEKKREEAALANLEKLQKDLKSEKRKKTSTEIDSKLLDKDVEMSDQKQLKQGIKKMSLQPNKESKKKKLTRPTQKRQHAVDKREVKKAKQKNQARATPPDFKPRPQNNTRLDPFSGTPFEKFYQKNEETGI